MHLQSNGGWLGGWQALVAGWPAETPPPPRLAQLRRRFSRVFHQSLAQINTIPLKCRAVCPKSGCNLRPVIYDRRNLRNLRP